MTNAELIAKIKAETDRLYDGEVPKHDPQCDFDDGYFTGISKVFDVIDSLQREQPEVDLEKEINELWKSLNTGHEYVVVDSYQDFLGICLHCFELGLNARKEEK